LEVVESLMERGISVHVLNLGLLEDTPNGRLIFRIWLAFADYERDIIVERTQTGKEIAKERDDFTEGSPRREIPENFEEYVRRNEAGEISVSAACKEMGVARAHWYRWKEEVCV
jgi:DNA invertase Pin-like site-specific DNA recombinase